MRVAFDVSSTRGQKTGIGVYTENLMQALSRYAPEVEVVLLGDSATVNQRTDRRMLREQFAIPSLAKKTGADILHLTGFAAPWRAPCPVVLTAQDLIGALFPQNFPPASRLYWSRYLPFTLRFAARLIVLSECTKRDVVRIAKIPSERINVIPPGCADIFHAIDDQMLLQETRARFDLPGNVFLFVSTLEPRKGVDTLIAAFGQIAATIQDDLVIVGRRGWYWEQYLAQVKGLGLEGRVHFLNNVSNQDLPLLYNLAHAFVFPSRYEGFGLTPLEAMACGAPVVCSNSSSLPEVVGDAGRLISPDDVEGFARAMVEVASNPAMQREMKERGLAQASKFSWERAARETVEVYRDIGL